MSASHIILSSLPSLCRQLSKLAKIWWSSDRNNFCTLFSESWCK